MRKQNGQPSLVVVRDGECRMRLPGGYYREHADGTLWSGDDRCPVISGKALEAAGMAKETAMMLVKAGRFSEVPAGANLHRGLNPCGTEVVLESEWEARRQERMAAAQAALSPAKRERRAINQLFDRAEAARHATDDDQMDRHFRLSVEASSRLKTWQAQYPAEAKLERAESLRAQAAKQESLSAGALTYDADGWIGPEEQEKRAAEFKAKAAQLRAEARNLTLEARGTQN